jgi:hypothetical protein
MLALVHSCRCAPKNRHCLALAAQGQTGESLHAGPVVALPSLGSPVGLDFLELLVRVDVMHLQPRKRCANCSNQLLGQSVVEVATAHNAQHLAVVTQHQTVVTQHQAAALLRVQAGMSNDAWRQQPVLATQQATCQQRCVTLGDVEDTCTAQTSTRQHLHTVRAHAHTRTNTHLAFFVVPCQCVSRDHPARHAQPLCKRKLIILPWGSGVLQEFKSKGLGSSRVQQANDTAGSQQQQQEWTACFQCCVMALAAFVRWCHMSSSNAKCTTVQCSVVQHGAGVP